MLHNFIGVLSQDWLTIKLRSKTCESHIFQLQKFVIIALLAKEEIWKRREKEFCSRMKKNEILSGRKIVWLAAVLSCKIKTIRERKWAGVYNWVTTHSGNIKGMLHWRNTFTALLHWRNTFKISWNWKQPFLLILGWVGWVDFGFFELKEYKSICLSNYYVGLWGRWC